jgi:hypothetical protein
MIARRRCRTSVQLKIATVTRKQAHRSDGSRKCVAYRWRLKSLLGCLSGSRLHDLSTEIWVHRVLPPKSALAPVLDTEPAGAVLIHHCGGAV